MTTFFQIWRIVVAATFGFAFIALQGPAILFAQGPGFQAVYDDTYAHYREAVFHARTGNTPVAALALDDFVVKWSALVGQFGDNPPAEYAGDGAWKDTLQVILTSAEEGLDALDADDPETAREKINPIRAMLGDLRRRNNIVSWSDNVDALSAAMEVLARYRKEVRDLEDSEAVAMVREQGAVVEAMFEKCRVEAVPEIAADPEFKRLVDGAAESMAKLWEALETKDSRLLRIGIGELRSYERILFLRFG